MNHLLSEVTAEIIGDVQVYLPAEKLSEVALHREEGKPGRFPVLELDEHVDVAFGAEVIPEDAAEKRELADMVAFAERGDGVHVEFDGKVGGRVHDAIIAHDSRSCSAGRRFRSRASR